MKGKAECLFAGGPGGDEILILPALHCRDRLSIDQDGWFETRPDGGVNVMQGLRPPNANWECFTRAVYEKDSSTETGRITYTFQGIETVNRCAEILALKDRRCAHEAQNGENYCRQHQKKMK